MRISPFVFIATLAVSSALSQAAPIRVGIFTGISSGRFWHTNAHTASAAITAMLAAPDSSNLGPNLVRATRGFQVSVHGVTTGQGAPNSDQKAAFLAALDSLDVVVLNNNVYFPSLFADSASRARLNAFFRSKGTVSLHFTSDMPTGDWSEFESLHGTRFMNHPAADRNATVHLDTAAASDPSWRFLNRGLPDTARFVEEWISFTANGGTIRANPGLKVALRIDEASYENGMGGAIAMGDHPMSWYRPQSGGGRFFYTGIGHRA